MGYMSAGGQRGPRGLLRGYHAEDEDRDRGLNLRVLVRLATFLRPHRGLLLGALLMMVIASSAQVAGPYLVKRAIDDHIRIGDVRGLMVVAGALALTYVGGALATARQQALGGRLGQSVLRDLRQRLFDHMQRLPMSFYDREDQGRLISYVVSDVDVINELLSNGLVVLVGDSFVLLGIIGIMLAINVRLALLSFTVIPLMVLLTWWFSRKAARVYRLTRHKIGAMIGRLAEDLAAVRVIKAFAEEARVTRRFERANRENRDAHVAAMSLAFAFRPGVDILAAGASVIVLWFGGRFALAGAVSVGTIVAFLYYVTQFFVPIQELSQLFTTVQSAAAGGERILGLLDRPVTIKDAPDAHELPPLEGEIRFDDVTFGYDPDEPVLEGLDLTVAPGEKVAIVGPTGAGKSTIANLIARHYDVTSGRVLLDGHDVREVKLDSLRKQLGVVPQEPFLFAATIADNIRFGRPDATDEEVREAARLARSDGFIESLPNGYNTWISEGAVNLSLGQRQLVCLARVMLGRPRLVILDEATSSVDTETERLVQEALEELMSGRTSIIIAHRLATVREVDRVIVLNHGRIAEQGSHFELLRQGGLYAELYHTQMAAA